MSPKQFTQRWWWLIAGIVILVILFFVYRKFTKKSEYVFPPTATSDPANQTTYTNAINKCEEVYINAKNSNVSTAEADLTNCISSNVSAYYRLRCPFLPDDTGATLTAGQDPLQGGGNILGGTSNAAYVAYTNDIKIINDAYTPILAAANQTPTQVIIQAARKADFTGATRKYFASLCPDLYSNTTGDTTLQSLYTGWTSAATNSSAYGFMPSNVTAVRIWEWAKYAGDPPVITSGVYGSSPRPLLTPLSGSVGTLTKSGAGTCTLGGWTGLAWGATSYWQLAADNGPGTVLSGTTFPWNTPESVNTNCLAANLIDGATASNPLP